MRLACAITRGELGLEAPEVNVEVCLSGGLPGLGIVGLAETTVKESRERVRAAIGQCGFEFPGRKIVVNLAPAGLPKSGGRFDLAIAVGVLAASGQIRAARLGGLEPTSSCGWGGGASPTSSGATGWPHSRASAGTTAAASSPPSTCSTGATPTWPARRCPPWNPPAPSPPW